MVFLVNFGNQILVNFLSNLTFFVKCMTTLDMCVIDYKCMSNFEFY